jgi:hypothetical protein
MAVMSEPLVEERRETFEDFFHAHHERLLRTMSLATGDRHEAEDLPRRPSSGSSSGGSGSGPLTIRPATFTGPR